MQKKLRIFLCVMLCLAAVTGFDYIRSKMFTIELVEMDPGTAVADGQTPVLITLQVLNYRKEPVEGHILFAVAKNGGMFYSQREVSGPDGMVSFTYFPYKASSVQELRDAQIEFLDESNSVFIEISTRAEFTVALEKPKEQQIDSSLLEGIFGE